MQPLEVSGAVRPPIVIDRRRRVTIYRPLSFVTRVQQILPHVIPPPKKKKYLEKITGGILGYKYNDEVNIFLSHVVEKLIYVKHVH